MSTRWWAKWTLSDLAFGAEEAAGCGAGPRSAAEDRGAADRGGREARHEGRGSAVTDICGEGACRFQQPAAFDDALLAIMKRNPETEMQTPL